MFKYIYIISILLSNISLIILENCNNFYCLIHLTVTNYNLLINYTLPELMYIEYPGNLASSGICFSVHLISCKHIKSGSSFLRYPKTSFYKF